MIVEARMKQASDQAVTIGWHSEAFARTKRLEPLSKLLEPEPAPRQKRASGTAKAEALFRRLHKKKE